MRLFVATAAAAFAFAGSAFAGSTLVNQVYDGVNGVASYETNVGGTLRDRRAADDVLVPTGLMWLDMMVTTQMAIGGSPPPSPDFFTLTIYDDSGLDGFGNPGAPGNILHEISATAVTFNGDLLLGNFPVFDVEFDLAGIVLNSGRYFFSPFMSNFVATQNVFFTTANTGATSGSEMFINFEDSNQGAGEWFAASEHPDQLFSEMHDGSMQIIGTAIPAPGALALLGLAGLAARRRRRA